MTRSLIAIALLLAMTASASAARTTKHAAKKVTYEAAMLECNKQAARFNQRTWGVREIAVYRSCMAEKGHPSRSILQALNPSL